MAPPESRGPGRTLGFGFRLRLWIATGMGLGHAPVAPGTVGSAATLLLVWALWRLGGPSSVTVGFLVITALGFWACSAAETYFGRRDPGQVVIDEVAGQMLSLALLAPTARTLVLGFVLFRLLDILKPFPVRQLEELPGGSGIMADDLMAGVYANLMQRALLWGLPGWWDGA